MTADKSGTCVSLVPIFSGLGAAEQEKVAALARPIRRRRGETIHEPTGDLSQLLVVHRGSVRISHLEASGAETLVRIMGPGEFIGEAAFLTGAGPGHWARALTDVELCSFDHQDLHSLVEQHPGVAVHMMQELAQRLVRAERRLSDLASVPVDARLARYLLDLPHAEKDGQAHVRLPHAKKDVASLLAMSAETLSRQLGAWSSEGLIEVFGRQIHILQPGPLRLVADG